MRPGPETILTGQARGQSVILRHPRWADYEAWHELRRASRAELSAWEPDWDEQHLERKAFKQRLSLFRKLAASGAAYPFHIFTDQGRLVGACNLAEIKRNVARSAQIGYWVGTPHARRGYGIGAVRAVTDFAFHQLGLHRVEAAVQDANAASVALLERAGYQREGVARGYLRIDGVWRDHRIYARLSSD